MKTVTVDLVMYPSSVTFIMGCTLEEFKVKARRIKQPCDFDPADYEENGGLCFRTPCGRYPAIWLANLPTDPESIGLLVHETHHAVVGIAKALGIRTTIKDSEFSAYANQYLVECVLKAVT